MATSIGSFPSGHVLLYSSGLGFIWFLAYTSRLPGLMRRLALLLSGAVILLIGPARVYCGEHWPSDVVAGYLLGSSWLALVIRFYSRIRARSTPISG